MNIFNKVKKGMVDSTKAIKEISSDVSEKTKLKVILSKDRVKVEEDYFNLGKILYKAYESNPDLDSLPDDVLFALWDLKATLNRIKETEIKINTLKGIIKCDQCDELVEEGSKFCPTCGKKLKIEGKIQEEKQGEQKDNQ